MTRTLMELADGRRLEVQISGPTGGMPLLFHHGTPGTLPPRAFERAVQGRGSRLITLARAGYAASTRSPGRAVLDVVADAESVLRAIGADRFVLAGWSGGGPHALACAAGIPGVVRTMVIAGVAPRAAQGLDFFGGMDAVDVGEWRAAARGERPFREVVERAAEGLARADDEPPAGQTPPDRDLHDDLTAANRHALSRGVDGWVDDGLALVERWGFDLDDVAGPVDVWHGTEDTNVPIPHGRWVAERVPAAAFHPLDGRDHLTILSAGDVGTMLDHLVGRA